MRGRVGRHRQRLTKLDDINEARKKRREERTGLDGTGLYSPCFAEPGYLIPFAVPHPEKYPNPRYY